MNKLPTPAEIMAKEPRLKLVESDMLEQIKLHKQFHFVQGIHSYTIVASIEMTYLVGPGSINPDINTWDHHAVMLDYLIGKMKEAIK